MFNVRDGNLQSFNVSGLSHWPIKQKLIIFLMYRVIITGDFIVFCMK